MTVLIGNARERSRFLRFAVVGVIGAVLDFGVANLLVYLLHAQLVVAGTVSFICAILSNFTWNRYWTYPDSRSKPLGGQLLQFSLVSVAGLLIRIPVLRWLEPLLQRLFAGLPFKLPVFSPDFLAKNVTLAIAVIIVMFWNFFVNRYWTYSDVE
ncbi:MAG: GtrA family protein [Chloroflexi bacterium]|nr:GtrA family protein [Chloroflexota bacterium]